MIFDNDETERLYRAYLVSDDPAILEAIHELCNSLIEVLAVSVCPDMAEDLIQEGHLKLRNLLLRKSFYVDRGSLYSFLCTSVRNHMVDSTRREYRAVYEQLCEDDVGGNNGTEAECSYTVQTDDILNYSEARFPSLHPTIARDASGYSIHSAIERTVEGYRGALRTLCLLYGIDRSISRTVYFSTLAVLRMASIGHNWQQNVNGALELVYRDCKAETSLLPETVLLLGVDASEQAVSVFRGSYIKF